MKTGKRLWVLAGLALVAAACSDSTSPIEESGFDPVATDNRTDAVLTTIDGNQALQSLSVLGGALPNFAATKLLNVTLPLHRSETIDGPSFSRRGDLIRDAAPEFSSSSPLVLLPADVLGRTFVFNLQTNAYEVDTTRTGAPADGVRFILYAVDPVLGQVVTPLTEIGHVDLIDKSAPGVNSVQILAVVGEVTVLDYTASGSISILDPSVTFSAVGFLNDGTNQVNFSISITATQSGQLTLDYELSVPSQNFSVNIGIDGDTSGAQITVTITDGSDTVVISATQDAQERGSGTVSFNGSVVVRFEDQPDGSTTFTDADGNDLTQEQINALKDIVDFVEEVFDSFDDLLEPACLVFSSCSQA